MNQEAKRLGLIGIVIVLIVGVVGGVAWYKQSTQPTATDAIVRAESHSVGPADAKVTLVEFGDYQCPACGEAEPIVEQVRKDYADKSFRFVFRNYPLSSLHPNAPAAAEAAEAAAAQGKFWEMHDLLYQQQNAWADSQDPTGQFSQYAKTVGVKDLSRFEHDVTASAYASVIRDDQKDGDTLNVQATPTFFLNGTKLEGVQQYADLKKKIDELLAGSKVNPSEVKQGTSSAK